MTAGIPQADPRSCPDCRRPVGTADQACAHCGLPLRGPVAVELWNVTVRLNRLAADREALLRRLRASAAYATAPPRAEPAPPRRPVPPLPAPPGYVTPTPPLPAPPAPAADDRIARWMAAQPDPRPRREWTAKRVQNLLLGLGVLLLVVAAVIFAVVAWGRLGIGGRALVLLGATAATGWGAAEVHRRELVATAEALGTLMLSLLFLDAYAVRRLGLLDLDRPRAAWFWAGAAAAVSGIAALYARRLPLRVARWSAVVGVQLPLPIALLDTDVLVATKSVALTAQSAAVVAVTSVRRQARDAMLVATGGALAAGLAALPMALTEAFGAHVRPGALALAALAGLLALVAWTFREDDTLRDVAAGSATALLLLATGAVGREQLTTDQLPALLAASGLLAVVASAALPALWRRAPLWVGAAGVALPFLLVAEHALTGLFGPYGWLGRPWSLGAGETARDALTPGTPWGGTVVVLVVLLVAAGTALLIGELGGRRDLVALPVTLTAALAVLLVPLGQAWSYRLAIGWDVVGGAALTACAVPLRARRGVTANALYASGLTVLASTLAWSLADDVATVAALGAVTVLLAAVAFADRATAYVSAGISTAVGCSWVTAIALWRGSPVDRAGFFLALAGAGCVAAGAIARRVGLVVAAVGSVAYAVGTLLAAPDAGWFAWSLLAGAVAASAVTAYGPWPRRVPAGIAGALAALWVFPFATSLGAPVDRAAWFTAAAGATLAAGGLLAGRDGSLVAADGAVAYCAAAALTFADPGWFAWSLAAGAVASLVVAVRAPEQREPAAGAAAAFGCGWVLPFAYSLGAPSDRAAFFLALAGAGCAVGGYALRETGRYVAAVGGLGYVAGAALPAGDPGWLSWSLAAGAVAAAAIAVLEAEWRAAWAAVSAALGCGWLLAFAASRDVPADRSGFLVVLAGAVLALGGTALRPTGRYVAAVGATAYAAGTLLAAFDPGWLSWSLLVGAVTALAVAAIEPGSRPVTAGLSAALWCGWTFTFAVWRGTPYDRAGFLTALAGSAAVLLGAAGARFDRRTGDALELIGAAAYVVALPVAGTDPGWLSWAFAVGGLTALADALREERRAMAWAGGLLLSAWVWTRLWIADVQEPEAYAAPVAATALLLGHLRRRADERVGSWAAYGPGLSVMLLPSLFVAVEDPGLARPLLLGAGSLVVVLWGARERLQAPLLLGGGTLAIDAAVQVAPYVGGLPRWIPIAIAGLVLVVVGVTFEQRRRDFERMRDRFEAMT